MMNGSFVAVSASVQWFEYASVTIAAMALLIGLSNRRIARRALAISERHAKDREPRISLYLEHSVAQWPDGGGRLLGFEVRISNPTERSTSLTDAELHVSYSVGNAITTLKLRHDGDGNYGRDHRGESLQLPTRLDTNEAVAGWLWFLLHDGLTSGRPIERYELIVRDIHGMEASQQVIVGDREK